MNSTAGRAARGDRTLPWGIAASATLVLVVLTAVLAARLTGYEASPQPLAPVVDSRQLGFRDLPGGHVAVVDWDSGETLADFGPGEGSFVRGVVRSLVRQRRGSSIDHSTAPFSLTRHSDGRLLLSDTGTGESVDLGAFGPTNAAVFHRLLPATTVPDAAGVAPGSGG